MQALPKICIFESWKNTAHPPIIGALGHSINCIVKQPKTATIKFDLYSYRSFLCCRKIRETLGLGSLAMDRTLSISLLVSGWTLLFLASFMALRRSTSPISPWKKSHSTSPALPSLLWASLLVPQISLGLRSWVWSQLKRSFSLPSLSSTWGSHSSVTIGGLRTPFWITLWEVGSALTLNCSPRSRPRWGCSGGPKVLLTLRLLSLGTSLWRWTRRFSSFLSPPLNL